MARAQVPKRSYTLEELRLNKIQAEQLLSPTDETLSGVRTGLQAAGVAGLTALFYSAHLQIEQLLSVVLGILFVFTADQARGPAAVCERSPCAAPVQSLWGPLRTHARVGRKPFCAVNVPASSTCVVRGSTGCRRAPGPGSPLQLLSSSNRKRSLSGCRRRPSRYTHRIHTLAAKLCQLSAHRRPRHVDAHLRGRSPTAAAWRRWHWTRRAGC